MLQNKCSGKAGNGESGNAVVVVLVAILVVAVGVIAYLSGQSAGEKKGQEPAVVASSGIASDDGSSVPAASVQQVAQAPQIEIKPGNPVVAKLDGQEISRLDVFNYLQTLPQETRQLPLDKLFPAALEQVVNVRVIENKTGNVNLDNDPEVKKQLEIAKKQIVRSVYIQNEVLKRVTDDRLKQAYEAYKMSFPKVDEVKAAHILIKEKEVAEEVLGKLKDGADFAALASEYSVDKTSESGGDLGYFLKTDVVPEFGEAAFNTEPGSYTTELIKSEFGYHIIKVADKRQRPPAEFEAVKPFLESQLRRLFLDEVIKDWRNESEIERFDINGEAIIEPAAGGEDEAAPAAAPVKAEADAAESKVEAE